MDVIKVSARSRTKAVAGAIAGIIRDHGHVTIHAIGAGAVNQAVKASALAREFLAMEDVEICLVPYFMDLQINAKECTAMELVIEPRHAAKVPSISYRATTES